MDIANYLSELLDRYGKVSVPGLGYFTKTRVNGYYNESENRLYPPGYQIQFGTELFEDDTLVQYIAEKKKISLASSKYFTEKYIIGLKEEVALKEIDFSNLGWFYMNEQGQIAFKPQEERSNRPDFYGYAPIDIKKLRPEPEQPVQRPLPVTQPEPAAITSEQEEYINDEPAAASSVNRWLITLIVIVVIALMAFGLYKYNPALFNFNQQPQKPVSSQPAANTDTDNTDTDKVAPPVLDTPSKAISNADTSLNKPVANTDTVARPEYVIFAGSFKTKTKSDLAIRNYKSIGIEARTLNGLGTGRLIKVIIGHFATYSAGEAERIKLVKSHKLRKDSYTQIINQKK